MGVHWDTLECTWIIVVHWIIVVALSESALGSLECTGIMGVHWDA